MVGEHTIVVEKRLIRYELTIRHKLNIIRGDSGSGKSFLDGMVYDYNIGVGSAKVRSDLRVRSVRTLEDLKFGISNGDNLFIFDENVFRIITEGDAGESVAEIVKGEPVYCIFITRESGRTCLPVDVRACYQLEETHVAGRTIRKNVELYQWKNDSSIRPTKMFTEDTKIGYKFFKNTLENTSVIKLGGTGELTKLGKHLKKFVHYGDTVYIVADGCAFGFLLHYYILEKERESQRGYELRLFLPPSFEYLVLDSDILPKVDKDVLHNTYKYCKVEKYMSLEKFYSDYLSHVTKNKLSKNSSNLLRYILVPRNTDKIYEYIGEIER